MFSSILFIKEMSVKSNFVIFVLQVEVDSLIRCREVAAQILKDKKMLPTGYQFKSLHVTSCSTIARSRSFKRKADHVDLEDEVYDGIKRLYNEESVGSEVLDVEVSDFTKANPVCAN